MAAPDIRSRPQDWAGRLHMSPRSFSRHFREHTGMSYAQWRQRACVVLALARLAAGDPVTVIALDFGYQGPAAFSTMFRRVLGAAPSAHRLGPSIARRRCCFSGMPRSRLCRSAGMPLGKRVSASGCQPLAYQRTAKKWQAVPASTNRCQTKCA